MIDPPSALTTIEAAPEAWRGAPQWLLRAATPFPLSQSGQCIGTTALLQAQCSQPQRGGGDLKQIVKVVHGSRSEDMLRLQLSDLSSKRARAQDIAAREERMVIIVFVRGWIALGNIAQVDNQPGWWRHWLLWKKAPEVGAGE
ncbi:MAG: hypothetical protein EON84_02570 [Bradyrhizobiaceae bacterium]|nr:MAG: hypothetical protein EON84_02570 [Bradyrhizobiaceae bacterium]